ncbi:MAG: sensor histidine kinase, partial [bacterium]
MDLALISADFRQQVLDNKDIQSLTVQIIRSGDTVPALLTGQKVSLPGGHDYELYLIYDMSNEQQSLGFVQRTLVIGGLVTLGTCLLYTSDAADDN